MNRPRLRVVADSPASISFDDRRATNSGLGAAFMFRSTTLPPGSRAGSDLAVCFRDGVIEVGVDISRLHDR